MYSRYWIIKRQSLPLKGPPSASNNPNSEIFVEGMGTLISISGFLYEGAAAGHLLTVPTKVLPLLSVFIKRAVKRLMLRLSSFFKNMMKENTVRDRRWRPIVDQWCCSLPVWMLCLFDMNKLLIKQEDFWTFSSLEKASVSPLESFYFTHKLQVTLTFHTFTCETPLTLLYHYILEVWKTYPSGRIGSAPGYLSPDLQYQWWKYYCETF